MTERDRRVLDKICKEVDVGMEILGQLTLEEFLCDETTKRAICMTVVNIGELVKGLSDDTRTKYPKVLWKDIAGMRDIAAHKYGTMDMNFVYGTASKRFPELKVQLSEILKD